MNIDILQTKPNINKTVKLTILPLAPLSMVSEIPGTYYKAEDIPDKNKLCGLLENILGWHFDKKDRDKISKSLVVFHRKKLKNKEYEIGKSNSSYQPLLHDFFEVGMIFKSETMNYNDLWKRSFSRRDEDVHPKGTPNLDYTKLKEKYIALKEVSLKQFYKDNLSYFPMYYTSPTLREYTDFMGDSIQIQLKMDEGLFNNLLVALETCSSAYLGNSEGWVEIKLEEI